MKNLALRGHAVHKSVKGGEQNFKKNCKKEIFKIDKGYN